MKQEKFLDIPRSPHFSVSKWRESSQESVRNGIASEMYYKYYEAEWDIWHAGYTEFKKIENELTK
ncbi:hypothetical protein [Oceanirhabdus sp. W0125-5]|uniref:hypothetical protein n=1 Tax=Oceanirhabdus sp. W0125-5 TaxID=2999116 RepID=UPI0022F330BC|nr:hypothetical protein [Oceanirhabdus sp. W0125-5]WBW94946.1 hypothetical protein OW730_14715 [Oceanirhabdus sp. W0125-5]